MGFCDGSTSGSVLFNVGSSEGQSANSSMAEISFRAIGDIGDISPLTIEIRNFVDTAGRDISVSNEDGQIKITDALLGDVSCDGQINIIDAMFVFQYDVELREGVIGCSLADPTTMMNLDVCDVNIDGQCNSTDGLFIMQCVDGFNVHAFCPNGQTLLQSQHNQNLNQVTKETLTTLHITADIQNSAAGTTATIPITTSVTDGLLGATTVEVRYDPSVLSLNDCNTNPNRDFNTVTCNETFENDGTNPDVVRFSAVSAVGVSGEALSVVDLIFDVVGDVGSSTILDIEIVTAGEPTGATIIDINDQDETVMVVPGTVKGSDTYLDISSLQIATTISPIDGAYQSMERNNEKAMDINDLVNAAKNSNGSIEECCPFSLWSLFRRPSNEMKSYIPFIISGELDTNITIPIRINDITNYNIHGYQLQATFDPTVLQFEEITFANSLSKGWSEIHNVYPPEEGQHLSIISITGYSREELAGQGELLYLTFKIVGELGNERPVTIKSLEFSEGWTLVNINK